MGDTAANLRSAAAPETREHAELYPALRRTARRLAWALWAVAGTGEET